MKDLELAYIAGFFDGEGSICIVARTRGTWNTEHRLWVAIGQKDGATLDTIKENFGGNVYRVKRDDSFYWAISNRNAYNFLKALYPYLQYKKPQAELAFKFYEEGKPLERPISKEELSRRESIREEIKAIKKSIVPSKFAATTTKRKDTER